MKHLFCLRTILTTIATSLLLTACAGNGNSASQNVSCNSEGHYCVVSGDTLSRIARRYNISVAELKSLNGLNSDTIHAGQNLRVKSQASNTTTNTIYQWPLQGTVFKTYSNSNRGIDIAAPAGSNVKSAADGQVVYAGNGISGYGNLVLIQHSNNSITAYANNDRLLVSEKARVKAGQTIATVGNSGRSDGETALHFEIRINGKAVNPLPHLPVKP